GNSHWVAYGMRGNVFHSEDGGISWAAAKVPAPISTYGHALLADGELLLVGQGGIVLSSKDGGKSFSIALREGRASLTDIVIAGDGRWMLSSDGGLQIQNPANPTKNDGAA
ncbi:MAG TPA: glycosyl hydrolase, partial [Thauera sp.]|nr:glycosyl hydrolase [Thauera sp.]